MRKRGVRMLIYGYAGSGKTTLLKTAPKPMVVFDFEGGADRILADTEGVTLQLIVPQIVERDGRVLQDSYRSLRVALKEISKRQDIKTLAFDGFSTYLRKRLLEIVNFRQGDAYYKRPEYQDWFQLQLEMDNFVSQFLYSTPSDLVIFIAHRRINKDEHGALYVPDIMPRKLMDNLVGYMDIVAYAASPDMDIDLEPYRLYLAPYNQRFFAKNRFGNPADFEPDLTELLKQIGFSAEQKGVEKKQAKSESQKNGEVNRMWKRLMDYGKLLGLTEDEIKEAFVTVCQEEGYTPSDVKTLEKAKLNELERRTMEVMAEVAVSKGSEQGTVDTEQFLDSLI